MKNMIVSITGTPGTGKTTIAQLLQEKNIPIIDLKQVSINQGFIESRDTKRDSIIIDIKAINQFIVDTYQFDNVMVIDGLVSHFLECIDEVIVFRCHPRVLKKRLMKRGWTWKKIKENLEAEMLDVILCESIEQQGMNKIHEIDTSNISIENTIEAVYHKILGDKSKFIVKPGSIDWSELLFDETIMEEVKHGS